MLMRDQGKRVAGQMLAWALPVCRYDHCLFVLAHMRCGSTALSNVLCSRADISGYGEAHVRHDGRGAVGRLVLNHVRRGGWKPGAGQLFDKILHCRHDRAAPPEFFHARAIFMLRRPGDAIASIVNLFRTLGRGEYADSEAAAVYYADRVAALEALWRRFPPQRRIGVTHDALVADPDRVLALISERLGVWPPLRNHYVSAAASRRGGGGDPLVSGRHSRIDPGLAAPPAPDAPIPVPPALARRVRDAHQRLADAFTQDFARPDPHQIEYKSY